MATQLKGKVVMPLKRKRNTIEAEKPRKITKREKSFSAYEALRRVSVPGLCVCLRASASVFQYFIFLSNITINKSSNIIQYNTKANVIFLELHYNYWWKPESCMRKAKAIKHTWIKYRSLNVDCFLLQERSIARNWGKRAKKAREAAEDAAVTGGKKWSTVH